MTNKLTIALDCDGVLFACDEHVHRVAERMTQRKLPYPPTCFEFDKAFGLSKDEMSALHNEIVRGRAAADMRMYTGAVQFVDQLLDRGHEVYFLTSHWCEARHWVTDREHRLKLHWPDLDVVFAHNKTRAQFDLLLDDRTSTVVSVGARGVLFDRPWNQDAPSHIERMHSYEEFLELVDKECEV